MYIKLQTPKRKAELMRPKSIATAQRRIGCRELKYQSHWKVFLQVCSLIAALHFQCLPNEHQKCHPMSQVTH